MRGRLSEFLILNLKFFFYCVVLIVEKFFLMLKCVSGIYVCVGVIDWYLEGYILNNILFYCVSYRSLLVNIGFGDMC